MNGQVRRIPCRVGRGVEGRGGCAGFVGVNVPVPGTRRDPRTCAEVAHRWRWSQPTEEMKPEPVQGKFFLVEQVRGHGMYDERGHGAGDRPRGIGDHHIVDPAFARVTAVTRELIRGRSGQVAAVGQRASALPPLVDQRRGAGCDHREGHVLRFIRRYGSAGPGR